VGARASTGRPFGADCRPGVPVGGAPGRGGPDGCPGRRADRTDPSPSRRYGSPAGRAPLHPANRPPPGPRPHPSQARETEKEQKMIWCPPNLGFGAGCTPNAAEKRACDLARIRVRAAETAYRLGYWLENRRIDAIGRLRGEWILLRLGADVRRLIQQRRAGNV